MKKVILVTLDGTFNFGNRLQHYALQQAIKDCGYKVDSLMVRPVLSSKMFRIRNSIKVFLELCGIKKFRPSVSIGRRTSKILSFNDRFISNIIRMPVDKVRTADWSNYDFAVTGSDQVWHNWHTKGVPDELSYYYLEFIEETKRVSYAPSFGFTSFPNEDIEAHRHGLSKMQALSCREQEGCDLIQELTGRKANKVLDPTLLLTTEEWESIEKEPHFAISKHYLLQFFLGDVKADYRAEIERIALERDLQILNINDKNDPMHYGVSPDEFIWLIHHSDTVCTDSFHASVFSIMFERNLRVFHRDQKGFENMFGRLQDLLELLSLLNVVNGEGENICTVLNQEAKKRFETERKASIQYLKNSLTKR